MPLLLVLLAALAGRAPAQEPAAEAVPLQALVNRAIARGVDRLRREQRPDGSWPGYENHPGGMTALAAYTLVKSGVRRNDESLLQALSAIERTEFRTTYACGIHLMLLEALHEPARRPQAQRTLDFLLSTQTSVPPHDASGLWAYPEGGIDMSNTQYALLGLRAAHRMGLKVPEQRLAECARSLWRYQHEGGGFSYWPGQLPTGSMTAAVLGGLAILEEIAGSAPAVQAVLRKHARDREAAERWYEERFQVRGNPRGPRAWTPAWHYYHLYALERYGGLTGKTLIGDHDWYREGARWLVEQQERNGAWDSGTAQSLPETCFALLFLRRATTTQDEEAEWLYRELDAKEIGRPEPPRPAAQVPFIQEWLLAGPWQGEPGNGILAEPPFDPAKAVPKLHGRAAKREWERVTLAEGRWTDLEAHTGRGGDQLLWALATRLLCAPGDGEPLEAVLWFSFDDGWSVWLDGRRMSFEQRVSAPLREDVRIPVELAPGEHLLLVLVEDDGGASAFSCRITDPQGHRLPDTFSVSPEPQG